MKKLTIVLAAALLGGILPATGQAQIQAIGLKAGLNLATQSGDLSDAENRTGVNLGASVALPLTQSISVQPELLYSQKGHTRTVLGEKAIYTLNYVELPILAKVTPAGSASLMRPSLFAGPALGMLVSSSLDFQGESTDAKDAWKVPELGLVVGGGIEFGNLTADLRYNLGLTSAAQSVEGVAWDIKNRAFSVMVGYLFPLLP